MKTPGPGLEDEPPRWVAWLDALLTYVVVLPALAGTFIVFLTWMFLPLKWLKWRDLSLFPHKEWPFFNLPVTYAAKEGHHLPFLLRVAWLEFEIGLPIVLALAGLFKGLEWLVKRRMGD